MNNLFSFTGHPLPDQNAQTNVSQYLQQGQSQINPGQAQVAASNPISAAGMQNLQRSFQQAPQQGPMGMQQAQMGLQAGAQMGQPGPTPQALALAKGLQPQPMMSNTQQFMNPGMITNGS